MTDDTSEDTPDGSSTAESIELQSTVVSSTYKVLGQNDADNGVGVLGQNDADSGTPIGVQGAVPNSSAGFGLATPDDARIEGAVDTNETDFVVEAGTTSTGDAQNVVAGHESNAVADGVVGAVVGGGGLDNNTTIAPNEVFDNYSTIGGGLGNDAGSSDNDPTTSPFATVGGGRGNAATARFATVGGGDSNDATDIRATVGGGQGNKARASKSTVAGGRSNLATGIGCTVGGGTSNEATVGDSTVAGGTDNTASGISATVGGGKFNEADAEDTTIAGGRGNTASGEEATVGGGSFNTATSGSTISGGTSNAAKATAATVGGGHENSAGQLETTVAGGGFNTASTGGSTVGGGIGNTAFGGTSTIAGGLSNRTGTSGTANTISEATVAGGNANEAFGSRSSIGGGSANRTGRSGTSKGEYAAVPGGRKNVARENYSLAAGRKAKARNTGAFVWADDTDAEFASDQTGTSGSPTGVSTFHVRSTGGVRLVTGLDSNDDPNAGAYLDSGGSSWKAVSTKSAKHDVRPVDPQSVLAGVESLTVSRWAYDANPGVDRMGPMAEEFSETFELGDDSETISHVDADGVALAAIQGISDRLDEKDDRIDEQADRIATLEAENVELRERLAAVEERLATIEGGDPSPAAADD